MGDSEKGERVRERATKQKENKSRRVVGVSRRKEKKEDKHELSAQMDQEIFGHTQGPPFGLDFLPFWQPAPPARPKTPKAESQRVTKGLIRGTHIFPVRLSI